MFIFVFEFIFVFMSIFISGLSILDIEHASDDLWDHVGEGQINSFIP